MRWQLNSQQPRARQSFMKIKMVPLHQLKPYENNVKQHPVAQLEVLVKSIKRYGFRGSVLIDKDNVIVAGHARYEAASVAGLTEIPCESAEDLTPDQIIEFRILDNEIAMMGYNDVDKFLSESSKIPDFDFGEFGVELPDPINKVKDGECDEDETPELKIDACTKKGDIWLLGDHRLMCGDSCSMDSVEKLMNGQKADMVFTDPPYGVNYQSNMRAKSPQFDVIENDNGMLDIAAHLFLFLKENSCAFIWTSHAVYPQWREQFEEHYKNTIIWYKACGGMGDLKGNYATDYEMALFCVKGRIEFHNKRGMAVWEIKKDTNSSYEHPTQKPVALAEKAIVDLTISDDIILDLFGGSGSTLIACEKTNRKCFMMEIAPNYCDVIIKRWQMFSGKEAVLESTGKKFNELSPLV